MTDTPTRDPPPSGAVRAVQTRRGSRAPHARQAAAGVCQISATPELAAFVAAQTGVFLPTASA